MNAYLISNIGENCLFIAKERTQKTCFNTIT